MAVIRSSRSSSTLCSVGETTSVAITTARVGYVSLIYGCAEVYHVVRTVSGQPLSTGILEWLAQTFRKRQQRNPPIWDGLQYLLVQSRGYVRFHTQFVNWS